MKTTLSAFALASAALLSACDANRFLPGAVAAPASTTDASALGHEGNAITVPEASPLRAQLIITGVQLQSFAPMIGAPGVVEAAPEKLVKITPPLSGRIVRLHRQLGDPVKAGDPLVTIDSPDLGAAHSENAKAQAALLQARLEFDRQKTLRDEDISARKDFEAAQQSLAAAESSARAASDRLAQLGASAGAASQREYVLRAPISGRLVDMSGAQGGYWNDITSSMMTVADLSTVWLSASVAEKDLSRMFVGQAARIGLQAYPGRTFEGKVKYIGDLLDADTRTARVRIAIDNRDGLFKPGMFAHVEFTGGARQALLVPATAVLQSGLDTRVFVETAQGRYEPHVVEVGATVADRIEVLSGLKAGDRIVARGGVLLND
ncbi:efflux RND transporter periplasmic adaptor subunit [Acidovorax sp. NCPPB 2350]|nr:efflux RND transporter periplasmic adaptor subunit [Acidovorax sp. NCPPB 2350]